MKYQTLGRTGLKVSLVSLGTGGKSVLGQRQGMAESESHRLIHKALDLGVNLFDTAPVYMESEAILGRALKEAGATHKVVLSTKVTSEHRDQSRPGRIVTPTPAEVTASVERSLQRLERDTIDLLFLHGVNPNAYHAVMERVYPELLKLKQQGKIRFIGISENAVEDIRHESVFRAAQSELVDVVMLRYTMMHQQAEWRIFPITASKDIGVIAMCPVDPPICRPEQLQTWLAELQARGALGPEALSDQDPVRGWIAAGADALTDAGMRFIAHQHCVDTILTGTSNPAHLEHNVTAALGPPLPAAVEKWLRDVFGGLCEPRQ